MYETQRQSKVKILYPNIEPFNHFVLKVDPRHQIYVEQCGNPKGEPILFLHGGPGAGCSPIDRRFFDPEKYHIILFDQRGCGRSNLHGGLEQIDTNNLIHDIEKIRIHLKLKSWHTFGGSWGSTLALLYAQSYPERVKSMILRGIFLAREKDIGWIFSGGGGSRIFPDYWQDYLSTFPGGNSEINIKIAYNIMIGEDKKIAKRVAKAWSKWESLCCTLKPNNKFVDFLSSDESCWELSRHEAHFMVNQFFISENHILNNCYKISYIPTIIVHGRYDIVCPFDNAWKLHQALPNSQLTISETAGHASIEPETIHHLVCATSNIFENEMQKAGN